ncbi:MAG: hypothetical protein MJE77_23090 [Proteobacteria bacterium]|nr:hypothetical protein [Pseudomonadota bacterium]
MAPIKILFLAAEPSDQGRIEFDRQFRDIETRLRASEYRESIATVQAVPLRPSDLQEALLRYNPTVVHFSGHGASDEISLVDGQGTTRPVSTAALAEVFRVLADDIRLVFMSSGFSAAQAGAIAEHIDFVIGMGRRVTPEAAARFASSFYLAIGFGKSVRNAFGMARAALMLEGTPGDVEPVLMVRQGADPDAVLVGPQGAEKIAASYEGLVQEQSPPEPFVTLPSSLLRDLEPLRARLHQGHNAVLPIVGSELSSPNLPSWSGFLKQLATAAPPYLAGELRELLARDQYDTVAELLEAEPTIGRLGIAMHIQRTYQRPADGPPEVHRLVAALPVTHFATTSYDPWLKQAVSRHHPAPRIFSPSDPGAFSYIDQHSPPMVLMVHGGAGGRGRGTVETCQLAC